MTFEKIVIYLYRNYFGDGTYMTKIKSFAKSNAVFLIALSLAIITSLIVKPDKEYLGYFDIKTLACLFCTLAVVCALKDIKFFTILARKIVSATGSLRGAVIALVFITFFGSMLIANDMALITFLPLGYYVLSSTGKENYMAFVFVMQNIAANLGGMLTPFGNPQNLYLYSKFNISNSEFISIMLPLFITATVIIVICCMFVKNEKIEPCEKLELHLNKPLTVIYALLFIISIAIVFRVIPYYIGTILVFVGVFIFDKHALKNVDYGLLLTFVCFFIFAGNMSRIESVRNLFTALLNENTLLVSIFSCQFISHVPSAILLSQFTDNYRELLMGVNIGGAGTLIASLASLITFREYTSHNKGKALSYLAVFTLLNVLFLAILTAEALII